VLLDEGFDILFGYVTTGDDVRARDLGPGDVDADDGGVEDLGVREEEGFQLGGGDSVDYVSIMSCSREFTSRALKAELGSEDMEFRGSRARLFGECAGEGGDSGRTGGLCI
jgi:hypothetical protein